MRATLTRAALEEWEHRPVGEWRAKWRVPELTCYAVTTSTNDDARARAEAGADHGAVVIAHSQTAGRGQRGRAWYDAAGSGLLISIVLRPRAAGDAAIGAVPLRVGLAVTRAVQRVAGVALRIKWPNDLQLPDGRKAAGVLCEAALDARGGWVVAGIGVNVSVPHGGWPDELRGLAGSLTEAGARIERGELAGAIVAEVVRGCERADPLDAGELDALARRDALRGRRVAVDGKAPATAAGIAPDGALLLVDATGAQRVVRSGTVRGI